MKLSTGPEYLNTRYKQKAGACVAACYGLMIEYFSCGKYPLPLFYKRYLNHFDLKGTASRSEEETITKHLDNLCLYDEKRKLEYVREFHLENLFQTRHFCKITYWEAEVFPVLTDHVLELRIRLIGGGLAIVIYKQFDTDYHCIIVGYCRRENKFFKRDPGLRKIQYEDFLLHQGIREYLYFEAVNG